MTAVIEYNFGMSFALSIAVTPFRKSDNRSPVKDTLTIISRGVGTYMEDPRIATKARKLIATNLNILFLNTQDRIATHNPHNGII
jgi:hypothetical protein